MSKSRRQQFRKARELKTSSNNAAQLSSFRGDIRGDDIGGDLAAEADGGKIISDWKTDQDRDPLPALESTRTEPRDYSSSQRDQDFNHQKEFYEKLAIELDPQKK